MSKNKTLRDFELEIRECVKCGICQAHCPAYLVSRKEGAVARGKITLAAALLDRETELEKALLDDVSMCLMCGSCYLKCPNKVPTHEIVGALRREITAEKGLSLIGRSVSTVLGAPKLMKNLAKTGAALSPLAFRKIPHSSGLRLRFPLPAMEERTLPPIASDNLFDRVAEFTPGETGKPVIGFFAGCSITFCYPGIGEKMVAILSGMGFSVYVPRAQRCCGIPALSAGDGALVEELAADNVQAFAGRKVEYIVTACASCNGGIGEYYRSMKADYREFTGKVVDFSVFLAQNGLYSRLAALPKWQVRRRVTYHDPCHLKIQGITKAPRTLLRTLPNADFVEMENSSACCGLGGTFSVTHYAASRRIGEGKVRGLRESRAELVATGCPGCIMQLQDIINHAGLPMRAVHLLDLLAEALGGP